MQGKSKWLGWTLLAAMVCAIVAAPGIVWGGEIDTFYRCRGMAAPPTIDGVVDAKEWAGTDQAGPLLISSTDAQAPVPTVFHLGYDSKKLYLAITCGETKPDKIVAKVRERDGDVYSDDCIELALDPTHEHEGITKFIINSLGTVTDFRYGFTDWNADVQIATSRDKDSWSVELAIPFSELDRAAPKPGEVWGLNVFRTRYTEGTQLLNWVNANGVFTVPTRLGHLLFDGPGVQVPDRVAAHSNMNFALAPELTRHGPEFEGKRWSSEENELAQDQSLQSTTVTPHIQMSGPFEQGHVRALAFVRMSGTGRDASPGTKARDLIELAERFDIEPAAVFVTDKGICGGAMGERRLRALLTEKFDAFIFAGCSPSVVPTKQLEEITSRVSQGAGMLCVGDGKDWLTKQGKRETAPAGFEAQLPMAEVNDYQRMTRQGISGVTDGANPLIAFYGLGKGRAALISFAGETHALTPALQLNEETFRDYDYWIGLAGFAAMWCAEHDSRIALRLPSAMEYQRKDLPAACRVGIAGSAPGELEVRAFVRDRQGNRTTIPSEKVTLADDKQVEAPVTIPVLPYGSYDLEVQVLRGKSVVGFSASRFSVSGFNVIDGFDVDKEDFVEKGDSISGRLKPSNLDRLDGGKARVELVTHDGRVISRQDFSGTPADNRFSFVIGDDTTIVMNIRASVLDRRGVVCMQSKPFKVPNRRRGTFNGVMWDAPDDPLGIYAYDNMTRAGFNVSLNGIAGAVTDATDCSALPYATRLLNARDSNGIVDKGCWNNEQAISKRVSEVVQRQSDNWKRGVYAYSLGDENDTLGCCLDPACLAAYRRYLADQYKTIDALNASWGESYKSFDDVKLLDGDDYFKNAEAFRTGKYARWFDRCRFAQVNYANVCGRFGDAFSKMDPKAITGFEGSGGFGDDIDAILDHVGMWSNYNSVFDDILRTLTLPEKNENPFSFFPLIHGNWMGYTKTAESLSSFAWRSVCLGANSLWWWRWDGIGQYRGFVGPTLDLWPATQALSDEMKVVRDGLGQLLMGARLADDGVAILYSVDSAVADQLPSEQPFGRATVSHSAIIHMLKDSGVQYRYVTPRRIAAGALTDARVLILPHCTSLAPETAAAIRSFVEQGGTLIADLRPGIMDNHVKMLAHGQLDDVFGVTRTGNGRAMALHGPIQVKLGDSSFGISALRGFADADFAAKDGVVGAQASEAPIFIANRFGKGHALLLNFSLDYFESIRDRTVAAEIKSPIIAACRQAGVRPPIEFSLASQAPACMTELTRWNLQGGEIISLRTDRFGWGWGDAGPGPRDKNRRVEVTLRQPKIVYDLRNHKCLGRVSKFEADVRTGYANFYGLFDQPLPKLALTCTTRAYQGGTALTASVAVPGRQTAVLLELVDPSGARPSWARRVVDTQGDRGTASWQLPANQPGQWKVAATELFTGETAEGQVKN